MRTCVIFNPTARGEKALQFRAQLSALAHEAEFKPTTGAGSARALAAEAVQEKFHVIAAAGGDGTVNEVLNGMADVPAGLAQARLAVLPLGTANVFARELRIPLNIHSAWQLIRAGRERTIDLPFVEWNRDRATTRRYFAQLAGAGLDARAVQLVDWNLKKRLGYGAYVYAACRAFFSHQPRIQIRNKSSDLYGEQVLIGNGQLYGGNFRLFPSADLEDGQLEVLVYPKVSLMTLVRTIRGLLTGDFHTGSDTVQLKSESLELTSEHPVPFEIDGELAGQLPITLGILPRALRVIAA